jgi:hypothetical protein
VLIARSVTQRLPYVNAIDKISIRAKVSNQTACLSPSIHPPPLKQICLQVFECKIDNSDIFEQCFESYWVGEREYYGKYLVKRYTQMIPNFIL